MSKVGESTAVPMDVDAVQPNSAAAPVANGAAPRDPVKLEQADAAEVCLGELLTISAQTSMSGRTIPSVYVCSFPHNFRQSAQ